MKPLKKLQDYREIEAKIKVRTAYESHKARAKQLGQPWGFTFETWCDMWLESGHWAERGLGTYQYCMARKYDEGGYSPDNVEIITNHENHKMRTNRTWKTQHGEGLTKNAR